LFQIVAEATLALGIIGGAFKVEFVGRSIERCETFDGVPITE
jgi:hypothetical protein